MRSIFFLIVSFSCFAEGPEHDLVALYHFDEDEGATSYLDSSYSSNDGSCTNCPAAGKFGVFNSAAEFDGSNDEIVVTDNTNLDNTATLTIHSWVYPTVLDGRPDAVVSKRVGANNNQSFSVFFYTSGRLNVDIDGSGDRVVSASTFTINRWTHIAAVYDGTLSAANRVRIYIDGSLDRTDSESSTSIPNYASDMYIGTMNNGYGDHFHGLIDELAIHDVALTTREIQTVHRMGRWREKFQGRGCDGRFCDLSFKATDLFGLFAQNRWFALDSFSLYWS